MKAWLHFSLFITVNVLFAQNNCNNLFKSYILTKTDTSKIRYAYELGDCYYEKSNPDSAEKYLLIALELIDRIKAKINDKDKQHMIYTYEARTLIKMGDIEYDIGLLDEAFVYYKKAQKIVENVNLINLMSACYNNLAIVFHKKGLYDSAAIFYFNSLKIDEKLNDYGRIAKTYNNLGNLHFSQKSYDNALNYYQKSLELKEKIKDTSGISFSYLNIGAVWFSRNNYKEALHYYNKSLELKKMLKDYNGIILLYNNIGVVFRKQNKLHEALHYYNLSLELAKDLNDKYNMAMIYENIAVTYYSYAIQEKDLIKAKKYFEKAIENSNISLKLSKEIKALNYISSSASTLFRSYFALGKQKEGMEYFNLFKETNDSLLSKAKIKAIAEAEKKFESEKKQLLIDNLTKERELQDSELKRQKTIIYSVVIGMIMAIVFAFLMVQRFRITRRQKKIIEKQKEIVDEKNLLLNKQNEEIKTQHEIVVKQKEHIEEIHKKLTDSINYAKKIQDAILPDKDTMNRFLGEHFILYQPKDIVSGDFYWVTKINEWLIVTVADCTGHGVPGAFMSMLGVSFLNEIVRKKEVNKASQVLNEMRKEVILALQQHCIETEQKDGMDISLFVINTNTYECQWAGANNPLIILKTTNCSEKSWELLEIKSDKMPIGIYPVMKEFTNYEFSLNKGDIIYLFTDGFYDQFGFVNGKKFLYKRFKELILNTATYPIKEQKQYLLQALKDWKGHAEQTDDITVLGLQI